jgi:hypothetical protein
MRTPTKAERKKAAAILVDGSVRGHKLTDRQRRFFHAVASGRPLRNPAYGESGREYDEDLEALREAVAGTSYYGASEFHEGSGLDRSTREVLQAINREFGDQAWTRDELAANAKTMGARGKISAASQAIAISKAIRPLLRRGAIVTAGRRRDQLGNDGAETYRLTVEGKALSAADRYASTERETESALEREIAALERPPEEREHHARTRAYIAPHAAAGKHHCKLCTLKHRLHEHRSHRVPGERIAENPTAILAVLPFTGNPEKRRKNPTGGAAWEELEGIDADSWARVADWMVHDISGGQLLAPSGRPVTIPTGQMNKVLRKWSKWAADAGAPDEVVADLEPVGKNPHGARAGGALERFLRTKPASFQAHWGELPAWVRKDPVARRAASKWGRINGVALDLVPVSKTPHEGIWSVIGQEVASEYRPFVGKRAGKVFRHRAGDHGGGKSTRPCVLAENAATGLQATLPLFGSRKRYGPRGITG